jgi:hypothetical protein
VLFRSLEKVGLIARRLRMASSRLPGQTSSVTPLADYVAYMVKFAPKLRPLKVMVDAGSGGAGATSTGSCRSRAPKPSSRAS